MNSNPNLGIKLLLTITERNKGDATGRVLNDCNIAVQHQLRGHGTANSEIMNYLGLDEPEKDVLLSIVPQPLCNKIFTELENKMHFSQPGHGIAFTIPLSGINLSTSQKVLERSAHMEINHDEEKIISPVTHSLVVAVVNHEGSDVVMDAAKAVGCKGGTVIKAKGIYSDEVKKFFNLIIQPEKEIVLMLIPKEDKQTVLQSVNNAIVTKTGEPGIVFSMPVDSVCGLSTELHDND